MLAFFRYFNSTMVRLKAIKDEAVYVYLLFQFHYGTIKSNRPRRPFSEYTVFQFHYGTIKSLHGCRECWLSSVISIPLWYD